jgi:hypothetical protein
VGENECIQKKENKIREERLGKEKIHSTFIQLNIQLQETFRRLAFPTVSLAFSMSAHLCSPTFHAVSRQASMLAQL